MIFLQQEVGMPSIEGAEVVTDLEQRTGADALVSLLSFPIRTKAQLAEHLEEGAVMVQVKRGLDLPSSVGGRLMESLARMCQYRVGHWQKQLLYSGIFTERNGRTRVNGRLVNEQIIGSEWRRLETSLLAWVCGGGTLVNVPNDSRVAPYLQRLEKMLKEHKPGEEAIIFPRVEPLPPLTEFDPERPLVQPIPAPVGMQFLAALPGIGPKLARSIYEECEGEVWLALSVLTSPNGRAATIYSGIGKGKIKAIREMLKLPAGTAIAPQRFTGGIEDDY